MMMLGIDKIIKHAILLSQNDMRGKLIVAVSAYRAATELLTLHHPLSDEEIQQIADDVDTFYKNWTFIFGEEEGVTNYIHLLGSGHVFLLLDRHKCLYLFLQQGWEALNHKIQTFFICVCIMGEQQWTWQQREIIHIPNCAIHHA